MDHNQAESHIIPSSEMTTSSNLKQVAETVQSVAVAGAGPVIQTAIAKGIHTSEFKMAVTGLGLAVLTGLGTALSIIPGPWSILGAGILGGLSIFGYGVSRGLAKSNVTPATSTTIIP